MTWIVAATDPFGYGMLSADIQVTFKNGSTIDILQKAYHIGPDILAGFSGSVEIGFHLIDSLYKFLQLPIKGQRQGAWHPCMIAKQWSFIANEIFHSFNEEEKEAKSRILMVGVSPHENLGDSSWPKVYIISFKSENNFEPEFSSITENFCNSFLVKVCSIGSGNNVREYKNAINELFHSKNINPVLIGLPDGAGLTALSMRIPEIIRQTPQKGISPYTTTVLITRGRFIKVRKSYFDENENKKSNVIVARGYQQYRNLIQRYGYAAAGAVC